MYNDGTEEEIKKDIYNMVVECCEAEQNRETNGGNTLDDDEAISEKPSRQEALGAASTILKYVSDIDQQYARKLEGILANFGRQTRLQEFQCLRPTTLTEFFASKDV
ncbi:hypothetical protein C0993_006430 [Termitomyces sp. T159_Od127]|nr:hypothetical protein C0993_006430 [Termitomyces sp. T159_Od127]